MKHCIVWLVTMACLFSNALFASNDLRSDTIDIRKTTIHFSMTDFVTKNISAKTRLDLKSKMNNVNSVRFDLEGLTVDSVLWNGNAVTFSHSNAQLQINTPSPFQLNDTALVDVFYRGVPVTDVIWGGFYFSGVYGFQMGVGFNAQPHSFGRTWHPCFDNFVERSRYEFYIETSADKMAVCNGMFQDSTLLPNNNKQWHWLLQESIPSYLACVAVAPYLLVQQTLNGTQGSIPAIIACEAQDANNVNGSFANLQSSFSAFEQYYGPHRFPRVGYSLVPFNGGAMEHATNIHIGKGFIDGTLNYENLIAHELSHHWWGDLVTCENAGDMWLNEGFASYSEFLHQEFTYGKDAYMNEVRQNHFDMLSRCHLDDNGYRSIANMDSIYTYGSTVYRLSADRLHTLRHYLGDTLFFSGLKQVLNQRAFQSISTAQLQAGLTAATGYNTQAFFTHWIYDKGFPHFSIDSSIITPNGNVWQTRVHLRQRKHQNDQYFNGVPLPVAFYDANWNKEVHTILFNGRCMVLNVNLSFKPVMISIDPDNAVGDAISDDMRTIKQIGFTSMPQAKIRVITKNIVCDSALVRVQHHWVAPDRFKSTTAFPDYHLCNTHYWQVDGIKLDSVQGLLHFVYDAGVNNSYLDSAWINNSEDSIRLFYRRDARDEWQFANDSIRTGVTSDRFGNMYAKTIQAGEYCLGIKKSGYLDTLQTDAPNGGCGLMNVGLNEQVPLKLSLYPNPTRDAICVRDLPEDGKGVLRCYNASGQLIDTKNVWVENHGFCTSLNKMLAGMYWLELSMNKKIWREKVMKKP
ncbi:MAG: M1 family aminopeptidase [Chitinophagaceae bacterium]